MTDFMSDSLFRPQRCFGTTRNFPTFRSRKSISWTAARLRAACRCCASRSRVKLPFRSEALSPASSRLIYKSGEQNAHDQPSAAKEYLQDRPLVRSYSPPCSCSFLLLASLLPYVITSPL